MTEQIPPGRGKSGQPYKEGNTRSDGSYAVGKGRTSPHTRFAQNDGRPRGRRAKGTRNAATEWNEELNERMVLTEGGRKKKVNKLRAVIKAAVNQSLKGNVRAMEITLRNAPAADSGPRIVAPDDAAIIAQWLEEIGLGGTERQLTDDYDTQPESDQDRVDTLDDEGVYASNGEGQTDEA